MRFLLVDRIDHLERGKSATGVKNVALSEDFLTHHFPDNPIMPGTLITESLVQLADWVIREASDFAETGLAKQFERLKFHRMVRPGDQIRLTVELLSREAAHASFRGRAHVGDHLVTAARFTLGVEALAPLHHAEDARKLFCVLYRPAAEAAGPVAAGAGG